ncbi:MAG: DUF6906 family protein [Lachnospiraceae bacterium]
MNFVTDYLERRHKTTSRIKAVKPTRRQMMIMGKAGLVIRNWLVLEETNAKLRLVGLKCGVNRVIKKSS